MWRVGHVMCTVVQLELSAMSIQRECFSTLLLYFPSYSSTARSQKHRDRERDRVKEDEKGDKMLRESDKEERGKGSREGEMCDFFSIRASVYTRK